MLFPRFVITAVLIGNVVMWPERGLGQESYPNKPIRIVTSEPGAANDLASRLVAQELTISLGQQVVVDNRGGAGGLIAAQIVLRAPPDGYNLLFYGSPLWLAPFLQDKVSYDPVKDFAPISMMIAVTSILVVHPSLPVYSVKELISVSKARPGELNYASGATGGPNHLSAELFKVMAGVNIVRVPYKGAAQALNALMGTQQVQLMFPGVGSVAPHIKSTRLRALAVTSARPSTLAPGLPTIAESGLPGYESVSPSGMFTTAKTSARLINRLNQEIVRALMVPNVKARLASAGLETLGSSPEEFGAAVVSEMARMGKLIKDAGFHDR